MALNDDLQAFRDKEKATTAAMVGLQLQILAYAPDGTEEHVNIAIANAHQWLNDNGGDKLDPPTRSGILKAAELALREKQRAFNALKNVDTSSAH